MLTGKQAKIIEHLVSTADGISDEAKKVILWLIKRSNNFSKNVALSMDITELSKDVMDGVHDLCSWADNTKINLFLEMAEEKKRFSQHCGKIISGKFDNSAEGRTVWISDKMYSNECEIIELDFDEISKIVLVDCNDLVYFNNRNQ